MADNDTSTPLTVDVNGTGGFGTISPSGDHDWFKVWLWAGHTYAIQDRGSDSGSGTLDDPVVAIRDASGALLATNDDGGFGLNSYLPYVAPTSGYYYVDASGFGSDTGTYRVSVTLAADTLATPNLWGTGATASDRVADFTGDGLDDMLQIYNGNIYTAAAGLTGFAAWHLAGSGATASDQIGNFDYTSSADLLQIYNGNAYVALSDGTGNLTYEQWMNGGVLSNATHADVDGDGREDLVQVTAAGTVQVGLSDGTSFEAFVTSNVGGALQSDQISSGTSTYSFFSVDDSDFNGDGRADLLQLYNNNAYVALAQDDGSFDAYAAWEVGGSTSTDRFGDFNGDGNADLLQIYNGTAYVAYSDGTTFGDWTTFVTGATSSDQIVDMNGDNRADLYQVYNGNAYVALATGAGGTGAVPFEIWASGVTLNDSFGDVNGDGLTDVVQHNGDIMVYQSIDVPLPDQHLFIV